MTPALEAYRRIASVYEDASNPVTSLERRVLARMLPELAGRTVVDVGTGTGYWAEYCRAEGARVIAIDGCWEMLRVGRGVRVQARAEELPFVEGIADVVVCSMMLGYAPEAFAELARIVRRGGTVYVTDLHPEAIASGWRRSFRVGAEVLEPEHRHYAVEDLTDSRLQRLELIEPAFEEPERHIFKQARKGSLFENFAGRPAIFAARWSRVC